MSHVLMVRDPEQYPAPHTAEVHPAEVENYAVGGWVVAEAQPEPEAPKRTRKPKEPTE